MRLRLRCCRWSTSSGRAQTSAVQLGQRVDVALNAIRSLAVERISSDKPRALSPSRRNFCRPVTALRQRSARYPAGRQTSISFGPSVSLMLRNQRFLGRSVVKNMALPHAPSNTFGLRNREQMSVARGNPFTAIDQVAGAGSIPNASILPSLCNVPISVAVTARGLQLATSMPITLAAAFLITATWTRFESLK